PTGETLFGRAPDLGRSLTRGTMGRYFDHAPILKGLVHRQDFERVGGFDSRFDGVEDFHFFTKLLAGDVRIDLLDRPRGFYRAHDSVTTRLMTDGRTVNVWLGMYEAIPRELDVPEQVSVACRRNRRYWTAREVESLVLTRIREKRLRDLTSPTF